MGLGHDLRDWYWVLRDGKTVWFGVIDFGGIMVQHKKTIWN